MVAVCFVGSGDGGSCWVGWGARCLVGSWLWAVIYELIGWCSCRTAISRDVVGVLPLCCRLEMFGSGGNETQSA